jgi:hypothetical protein
MIAKPHNSIETEEGFISMRALRQPGESNLYLMKTHALTVTGGDGISPEFAREALKALKAAVV